MNDTLYLYKSENVWYKIAISILKNDDKLSFKSIRRRELLPIKISVKISGISIHCILKLQCHHRRAKRAGTSWNTHRDIQKIPPILPKTMQWCSRWYIFQNSRGGGEFRALPFPSRSAPGLGLFSAPNSTQFRGGGGIGCFFLQLLKSFWTCQWFELTLKILLARTIKCAAEILFYCQSEWNFVSQILRSDTCRPHCFLAKFPWTCWSFGEVDSFTFGDGREDFGEGCKYDVMALYWNSDYLRQSVCKRRGLTWLINCFMGEEFI